MQGFTPPHSQESEKAVLGSILKDSNHLSAVVAEGLLSEHFFLDAHRQIFQAMMELDASNEPPDFVAVVEMLKRGSNSQGQEIGLGYLVELMENAPVAQNVGYYANQVKKHFYLRRIVALGQSVSARAATADGDVNEFLGDFEKEILSIFSAQDRSGGIMPVSSVLAETLDDIEARIQNNGQPTGVPTGFHDLDKVTGGFQRSDLIVLAARPAMGKTALALNFASHACKKGFPTVVFSLEMPKKQLITRLISAEGRIDSSRLRKGDLSDDDLSRLSLAVNVVNGMPISIDDTGGITLVELRSRLRRYDKELRNVSQDGQGLGLVIIDYLQLMGSSSRRADSREREVAELSGGLKALAKELDVPIIVLSQLNRSADTRTDHRPKTSDLRESGAIEQDADLIMFVYRDEYYNPNSEDVGKAEIIISKNRHGELAEIKLACQLNFVSFYNLMK
jgi:replicative DNA helicase